MEPEKSSSAAAKQTMEAEAGDAVDPHELGNKLLPHQIATPQRTPPFLQRRCVCSLRQIADSCPVLVS
jgi:hypothetical protein